jgi:hypothetical protein
VANPKHDPWPSNQSLLTTTNNTRLPNFNHHKAPILKTFTTHYAFEGASASSTTSAMPISFLSLPPEIRNEIYKYIVVQREPIICYTWSSSWELLYPLELQAKILRANKTIHHEASFLLYSQNSFRIIQLRRFELGTSEGPSFAAFLKRIGPENASYLQHIVISFPRFNLYCGDGLGVNIRDDDARVFNQLRQGCTSLKVIQLNMTNLELAHIQSLNLGGERLP